MSIWVSLYCTILMIMPLKKLIFYFANTLFPVCATIHVSGVGLLWYWLSRGSRSERHPALPGHPGAAGGAVVVPHQADQQAHHGQAWGAGQEQLQLQAPSRKFFNILAVELGYLRINFAKTVEQCRKKCNISKTKQRLCTTFTFVFTQTNSMYEFQNLQIF